MIEEIVVLRELFDKEKFLTYSEFYDKLELEQEAKVLFNTLKDYFEEYSDVNNVTLADFRLYFNLKNPLLKTKESYIKQFEFLEDAEVNDSLLKETIVNLIERYYATEIVNDLTSVLQGTEYGVLDFIQDKLDDFKTSTSHLIEDDDPNVSNSKLSDILAREISGSGLKWRLHCLNYDIGDLYRRTLGHIFARPNVGKTTLLASEVVHFAEQLEDGECIVWFANEEDGERLNVKLHCAAFGLSKAELLANKEHYEALYQENYADKIVVIFIPEMSISQIENYLRKYKPRVTLIDQGDNVTIKGKKDFSETERLKVLYRRFRVLAALYDTDIITTGQADKDAEGKKWLTQSNMDYSKVGKPGALDWAIGIGQDFKSADYVRYISIVKNKMKDGHHGRWEVTLDAVASRYADAPISQSPSTNTQEVRYETPSEIAGAVRGHTAEAEQAGAQGPVQTVPWAA